MESTPITSFLGRYAGEVWGGDMSDKINVMLKEAHKRPHIKKSPLENPNDVIELMKKRELMVSVGLNSGGYQIYFFFKMD